MASFFDMNQIGSAQRPQQGFLQRGLLNPLTHLGLGLLAESAPRASYDPGQVMPNYGRGLLAGAQSYNQVQQRQQYMDEMMRMRQQEALAKQQQAARELEQAQQQAQAQQAYLLTLPEGQRAQAEPLLGMGLGPDKIQGLLNPKQDLPPEARLGEWLVPGGSREEQQAAVQQWKLDQARAGASSVNTTIKLPEERKPLLNDASRYVNEAGESPSPLMTPEEAVASGFKMRSEEQSTRAVETAKGDVRTEQSMRGFDTFVSEYEKAAKDYKGQVGLGVFTGERGRAGAARKALVAYIAKNVLGTPGAEPSPALYDQAEAMVPDFAGPIDSRNFDANMQQLRAIAEAKTGKGQPAQTFGEDDAPPPNVPAEVWNAMTPQERALFR